MFISKKYLKSKPVCKVTFRLPKEALEDAKKVFLVGDFNDWNQEKEEMKILKDGSAKTMLDLEVGKSYQYKFLIDGEKWENDWKAEAYVANGVDAEENSLVSI
jgi:1,4-alpha-glucan branching enzyme